MLDSPQVLELLAEALESDRTPDEVCAGRPELLEEVRLRWEECRRMKGEIDAFFPYSDPPADGDPTLDRWHANHVPQIAGYEVGAILGRGGMGVVYRALHLGLNRTVALKMLLSGAYASPIELARFLREARAVAGLKHPNVVQVYDVGEFDARPFFTMELVDGGTLADKLDNTPQPSAQSATMTILLADAVESAHRGGIVHRDLKPSNILLASDGSPKISDFGLARNFNGDDALTIGNVGAGTPSYMAPEQVTGSSTTHGPAGDVYSLGVILYEMLTGRPPFRGESPADTRRQLLADEPVPPSRLNTRVPRDLETICLKCLQKEPRRRYETAQQLADDLRRFQRHEPILARSAGRLERAVKWIRRHPTSTTAAVAAVILTAAAAGAALWLASDRAAMVRAAEMDLSEAILDQEHSDWPAAASALERANLRLRGGGPVDLRARLEKARADSALVVTLEKIRLDQAISIDGQLGVTRPDTGKAYAAAFRDAGLIASRDDPKIVAQRLHASPISDDLLAALDHWVFSASGDADPRLVTIVRLAHAKPDGSMDELLPLVLNLDEAGCNAFVEKAPLSRRSLPLLLAAANKLPLKHRDPTPMLYKLQEAFPDDFWANEMLGSALDDYGRPEESLRFLQTALGIRPDVGLTYNNLGRALFNAKRYAEAGKLFEKAIQFDPKSSAVRANLAAASLEQITNLKDSSTVPVVVEAAKTQLLAAIELDPTNAVAHYNMACIYVKLGKIDDAIAESRKSIALNPTSSKIQAGLRMLLTSQHRTDEALAAWRASMDANPQDHACRDGYAEYCLYIGRTDAYEQARSELLDRFGNSDDPHTCECTGRACLLLPSTSAAQLQRATAAIDRAVAAGKKDPQMSGSLTYYLFSKGLAEYRAGHIEAALTMADQSAGVLGPAPGLLAAMAEFRLGRTQDARDHLAAALASSDWRPVNAGASDARERWIYEILRREAETTIGPQPQKFAETHGFEIASTRRAMKAKRLRLWQRCLPLQSSPSHGPYRSKIRWFERC